MIMYAYAILTDACFPFVQIGLHEYPITNYHTHVRVEDERFVFRFEQHGMFFPPRTQYKCQITFHARVDGAL